VSKTTFKIRVDSKELESWRLCATKSLLTLSEWMRRRCNGEGHLITVDKDAVRQIERVVSEKQERVAELRDQIGKWNLARLPD
jgi:hypothetical protein